MCFQAQSCGCQKEASVPHKRAFTRGCSQQGFPQSDTRKSDQDRSCSLLQANPRSDSLLPYSVRHTDRARYNAGSAGTGQVCEYQETGINGGLVGGWLPHFLQWAGCSMGAGVRGQDKCVSTRRQGSMGAWLEAGYHIFCQCSSMGAAPPYVVGQFLVGWDGPRHGWTSNIPDLHPVNASSTS